MRVHATFLIVLFLAAAQAQGATVEQKVPMPLPRPAMIDDATPAPSPPLTDEAPTVMDVVTPPRTYQAACPALLAGQVEASVLPPIRDGICGLRSPLSLTAVMIGSRRVALSQPAVVNCAMAGELARWAVRVDAYTQAVFNAGIDALLTGTSYMCRTRNSVEDADVSEHGFGNAIDLTGFTLATGERISLPDDWGGDGAEAGAMELAHDMACGHFTTVLGPETNALHADHLHFDLGCHGRTCTARLCE